MGKIRKLPQELINLIAAGEVVERPASVLKELLENSIDAESARITVNITDYGKGLIEVIDDGIGMNEDDAILAFEQHATSKIQKSEDLENIVTLGFRGEALASISSVAQRVDLETKTDKGESIHINIENSKLTKSTSTKVDRGTKISIYNIFENVPARKKFLKSDNTELKYLINTFLEIALVNLNIHFEIYHNSKLQYRLTKANNIKDRMFEIWGNTANNFYAPRIVETDLCKIELVLEKPENAKKNTNIQYIYVNGRKIDSKVISMAAKEAYQGFIHKDLKPSYIILIHIDPRLVDVNVHPRKLEVRFLDPQGIFRTVFSTIRKSLELNTKDELKKALEINNDFKNHTYKSESDNFISSLNQKSNLKGQDFTYPTIKPKFSKVQDAISFNKALFEPTTNGNEAPEISSVQESIKEEPLKITQFFNTYIVYEREDELIFIDQHAAAEKITFEKLLYSLGSVKTKPLLIPTVIDLKPHEKEIILNKKNDLEELGIVIEDFGGTSIQLVEIPEFAQNINVQDYLHEIINNKDDFSFLSREYADIKISNELYDLLALTACHGSIRAGQKLSESEMLNIINGLKTLKQPNNCPHGRPTSWKISKNQIEKNFKRAF